MEVVNNEINAIISRNKGRDVSEKQQQPLGIVVAADRQWTNQPTCYKEGEVEILLIFIVITAFFIISIGQ